MDFINKRFFYSMSPERKSNAEDTHSNDMNKDNARDQLQQISHARAIITDNKNQRNINIILMPNRRQSKSIVDIKPKWIEYNEDVKASPQRNDKQSNESKVIIDYDFIDKDLSPTSIPDYNNRIAFYEKLRREYERSRMLPITI